MGAGRPLLCVYQKVIHDVLLILCVIWSFHSYIVTTPNLTALPVVDCFNLTQISSGMISYSGSGESTENRPIGTVTTYSCDTGYTLNGDRIRTCQSDGTWSGSAPTCKSESLLQVTHTMTILPPQSPVGPLPPSPMALLEHPPVQW